LVDPLAKEARVEALNDYLTDLASESPAPGGGSAGMVVGATGCALVSMVARICAASPKYESKHLLAARIIADADALREGFLERKTRDERAFDAVVAAKGDKQAMQQALAGAAAVPLEGAQAALQALQLAADALELGNANLVSDVGCAAEFAHAAMLACAYNVRINHKFLKDESLIASQRGELERIENAAAPLLQAARKALSQLSP
jgi:formiminotetrahydrofolate cyclodeaminase